jgi:hypothetical protein
MANHRLGGDCCSDLEEVLTDRICYCGCALTYCRSCYSDHAVEVMEKLLRYGMVPVPNRTPDAEESESRMRRQILCYQWVTAVRSAAIANDLHERVKRIVEEATELAQAEGLPLEMVFRIVQRTYGRPVGKPEQEVGGIMTTLMTYCQAKGISLYMAEVAEFARALCTPYYVLKRKYEEKVRDGVAAPIGKEEESR